MKIAESERRREGFRGGVPIALADGQPWHFPRPIIDLVPAFDAAGEVVDLGGRFAEDYEAKLEAFYEAADATARIRALMALAVDLLRRNYDLTPEELRGLLRYRVGDPENTARWRAIGDVAQGNGPKRSPAGDE